MNTASINKAFEEMIHRRAIHHQLGISSGSVRLTRWYLKRNQVSLERKLMLLKRTGWMEPQAGFSRADMIRFAKFYHHSSEKAKGLGAEYLLEKWERLNN